MIKNHDLGSVVGQIAGRAILTSPRLLNFWMSRRCSAPPGVNDLHARPLGDNT
jgi:hypothetical protein